MCHKADVLQRTFLRKILNVTKLDKIRNTNLYLKCKTKPWSEVIKTRRIRFLGHVLRLDNETPAKQALQEFLRPVQKDRGRPPTTWWSIVKKDLNEIGIKFKNLNELERLASDRSSWRGLVKHAVPNRAE